MQRRQFCKGALGLATVPLLSQSVNAASLAGTSTALGTAWAEFSRRFVLPDGRVVDTGNKGITHTEGLGVAMLAAQACGDRARFDKIWAFAQQLHRPDGLFSWKWVPGTGVADKNNATDGDLYMAWALLRAGVKWNDDTLLKASQALAKSIREQLHVHVTQGSFLLPGHDGFIVRNVLGQEKVVVNPSYWVFPALRELQAIDPSSLWPQLYKDGMAVLEYARFGPQSLPSDWLILEDPVMPWQDRPARFGYEAIRIPLFLAWERKTSHTVMRSCGQYMKEPKFPAWVSLADSEKANYIAPAGFEAIARLVRKTLAGTPLVPSAVDSDYYSSSLVLLSALAAQALGWS